MQALTSFLIFIYILSIVFTHENRKFIQFKAKVCRNHENEERIRFITTCQASIRVKQKITHHQGHSKNIAGYHVSVIKIRKRNI